MRSVDSETDNEVSEEDISDDEQEDNYYVGKDGTCWSKIPLKHTRIRPHNILITCSGVLGQAALNAKKEIDFCNLFFSNNNILNLIILYTNQYINMLKEKYQSSSSKKACFLFH